MRTSLDHFASLWQRLGAKGDSSSVHARLVAAWSEPARAYHGVQHLEECLGLLDQARAADGMKNPDAVEMALWMHDAVYDPKAADNEERSAVLAHSLLNDAGVSASIVAEVERLVLVTKTHLASLDDDSAWMVDIDLAILGSSKTRFSEYETQIRQEYAWVPRALYVEKRAEVLQRFLHRERLFLTSFFHDRFEAAARENLARAIAELQSGPP